MDLTSPPSLHQLSAVSERTGLSRSTLYREIDAGHLRALKIGRSIRISESELVRYIHSLEQMAGATWPSLKSGVSPMSSKSKNPSE